MKTDSPSPDKFLGQLTKVLALLQIQHDQLQVVIDHPKVREELRQSWRSAMYPPKVQLLRALIGAESSITQSHHHAAKIDFDILLGCLDEGVREIIIFRWGMESGKMRRLEEVAKQFNISRDQARKIEARAMTDLREQLRYIEFQK